MENTKNTIFRDVDCLICGNRHFSTVIKFTPAQFLNKERREYYNLKALGIDWNTNFYIKKCRKCGFVMVNPRLREDLYNVVYNEAKVGQYQVKDWMFGGGDIGNLFNLNNKYREIFPLLNALQFFKNYFKKPKNDGYCQLKLLDYGCGLGHVLELCKVFGIDGTGVEIDQHRLNHCKKNHLNVMLPSELPDTEKFHIVISTSVVEHVDDLDGYFGYVSDRLLKDGIFYFNGLTPNIISIEKRRRRFKLVMPLEHINYFTRKTLLMLAKKHGFEEAKGPYGAFAIENLFQCTYPLLKKFIFRGFYPTGNFEITLRKK
jgi:2-polyprenyl-3-methyl-5-hydroxy-6-metoxy-1,4-benzoquinol methylase